MSLPWFKGDAERVVKRMQGWAWPATPPRDVMHNEVLAVVAAEQVRRWSLRRWSRCWAGCSRTLVKAVLVEVVEWLDEWGGEWWAGARRADFVAGYSLKISDHFATTSRPLGSHRATTAAQVSSASQRSDRPPTDHFATTSRPLGSHIARDPYETEIEIETPCQTGQGQPDLFSSQPDPDSRPAPKSSPKTPSGTITPEALLETINRLRPELELEVFKRQVKGWTMSKGRKPRLRSVAGIMTAEGLTLEGFEAACRWVYLSEAPNARGARGTAGGPISALLRDEHVLNYIEAAQQGLGMPGQVRGSDGEASQLRGSPFQALLRAVQACGRFPQQPAVLAQALATTDRPVFVAHMMALVDLGPPSGDERRRRRQGWGRVANADAFEVKQLARAYDEAWSRAYARAQQEGAA